MITLQCEISSYFNIHNPLESYDDHLKTIENTGRGGEMQTKLQYAKPLVTGYNIANLWWGFVGEKSSQTALKYNANGLVFRKAFLKCIIYKIMMLKSIIQVIKFRNSIHLLKNITLTLKN